MPFKSYAQQTFMEHHHPAIAARWKREHGSYHGTVRKVGEDKTARTKRQMVENLMRRKGRG